MAEATVESIEIDAEPQAIFDVAADIARYPEWANGVREVRVIEVDDDGRPRRAAFVIEAFVKEITYELTYRYDFPTRISWEADPSPDIDRLEGSYSFTPSSRNGVTEVVYALSVEPTFHLPGFIRRQAEKQIVTTALRGLRQRVGQLGGP